MNRCFFYFVAAYLILTPLASVQTLATEYISPSDTATQNKLQKDINLVWTVKYVISNDSRFAPFAENINVASKDGVVTLTGIVYSQKDRADIDSKVRSVSGVKRVINYLQLQ